jgi:sigma-B regulation protein RsbU (phosphoserine phosphatase)
MNRAAPPMLLRRRIVIIFCFSTVLLVAVVGGSLGLLWRWNVARLAEAERETARARWSLSLEQSATFYETVALPLAKETQLATAVGHFDREAIAQRLTAAMRTETDSAPISRIDLADNAGIIASTAGLIVTTPMIDTGRTTVALRRGYPVVGPELTADGRWLFVVTVEGPDGTLLSIAADLLAILPDLASIQRADMFIIDRAGKLAASTNTALWNRLHATANVVTDDISYPRTSDNVFIAVPLPLNNSSGTDIGTLLVVRDITLASRRTRLILLIGSVTTLLLLGATSFAVYAFTRGALDPLADITRTVRALANGNLSVRPDVSPTSKEIADIATATEVFRSNAIELDRRQVRETLRNAQQHALIRREMSRLASALDEPARNEVLSGLTRIEADAKANHGAGGATALAAGFQMMTGRVTEQHRQVTTLLHDRTRDLQIVQEALAEREQLGRLREELEFARHLQMSSLPATFPPYPDRTDFTIFASMQPAKEVGGDFYDFVLLDGDRLALLIGDASGKGVSAAMFIATCRALLRSALVRGATPAEALETANAAVASDNQTSMFATVFVAILDLRSGSLRYANAGHNPPYLLRRDMTLTVLDQAGGIALGAIESFEFETAEATVAANETLFLFTDGVTEAYNPAKHLYGEERLEQVLLVRDQSDPESMIRLVSAEIQTFARGEDQADDMTMLSVVYLGQSADHAAQAA